MTKAWPARLQRGLAFVAVCGFLAVPLAMAGARADTDGEAIYRHGVLPSGALLQGERDPGLHTEGAAAACVNCHRRSGLGMREGRQIFPPIAGRYLFYPRAHPGDDLDLPFVESMRGDREPYTEATLARAIRDGIGVDGKPLGVLMPRFELDDAAMADLIAYLRTLAPTEVPGVKNSVLHFATIFTPDADAAARKGVLDVLQQFFDDKNHHTRAESPRLRSSRRLAFMVNRHWELHVWQLNGAPETWETQLRAKLAAEPVYAVISGVGGKTWAPVHHFCEAEALPCLFPNVDLPVDSESDFHDVYFSKGVLLEAQLIARDLRAHAENAKVGRVVQIFRANDVGGDAAKALASELVTAQGTTELQIVDRSLTGAAGKQELTAALRGTGARDVVVLWLRPADIAALGPLPAGVALVYMSGRMGGLEQAPLSAAWRSVTHMAYPFDLPNRRRVQVDYPLGWFRIRKIPVVALQPQADAYLACIILSETINHMSDTFQRDYLVERIEEGLEHRILTGYYPRLALAPGQAFASKGGYMVHFAENTGTYVIAEGDWTAP
jgi:cytochrome c553